MVAFIAAQTNAPNGAFERSALKEGSTAVPRHIAVDSFMLSACLTELQVFDPISFTLVGGYLPAVSTNWGHVCGMGGDAGLPSAGLLRRLATFV